MLANIAGDWRIFGDFTASLRKEDCGAHSGASCVNVATEPPFEIGASDMVFVLQPGRENKFGEEKAGDLVTAGLRCSNSLITGMQLDGGLDGETFVIYLVTLTAFLKVNCVEGQ